MFLNLEEEIKDCEQQIEEERKWSFDKHKEEGRNRILESDKLLVQLKIYRVLLEILKWEGQTM